MHNRRAGRGQHAPRVQQGCAMHQIIHIWHEGNLLKIGHWRGNGISPEPPEEEIQALLSRHMEYNHVEYLRPRERYYDAEGKLRKVRTTHKRLWRPDPGDGLFTCGAGYLSWVVEKLGNLGYDIRYKRIMPPRPRPNWAELDLDRVYDRYQFRPGQEDCFAAIVERILAGLGGVVDASVGFGKSDLIAPVAMAFPNAKVVVAVRRLDLVNKTVVQLSDYLPSVGQVDGSIRDKEFQMRNRVVVYSLDSFEHFDGDADIVFFDEAHEAVTDKHAQIIAQRLDMALPIALTATPDARMDNADARLESLIGPTIFYMPYARCQELGLVVPIRVIVHPVRMGRNPVEGLTQDAAIRRHGIWRNRKRNRIIADVVGTLADEAQVLILVATMDHLVHLKQFLPQFTPVWAESSNAVALEYAGHGLWPDFEKMTPKRRAMLQEDFKAGKFKKAIATIWDQGVSFDQLQVLFWARGGTSAIKATQGPGRVSRIDTVTGKAYGEVHELDDEFDPGLHGQFLKRARIYVKHGWTVTYEEPTG
jgi:superfamily II DNA or RNA helicase